MDHTGWCLQEVQQLLAHSEHSAISNKIHIWNNVALQLHLVIKHTYTHENKHILCNNVTFCYQIFIKKKWGSSFPFVPSYEAPVNRVILSWGNAVIKYFLIASELHHLITSENIVPVAFLLYFTYEGLWNCRIYLLFIYSHINHKPMNETLACLTIKRHVLSVWSDVRFLVKAALPRSFPTWGTIKCS